MLAARLHAFGRASEVLRVDEIFVPQAGFGELLVEMLAAPVNPADLNIIEGKYGELPELPAVIGNEGVGRVLDVGVGVSGFAAGDLVLPMSRGTWTNRLLAKADDVVLLPAGLDVFQAAMLTVNPPSAWAMLHEFVKLNAGDWIVQNAANSAVGRSVIQIARSLGWRTLNVVRRPELIDELRAIGGDVVVLEDCDLRTQIAELCGKDCPRLALNAVGGASALNLANALADEGTLVTYGAMGRQPLKIPNGLLIFRNLHFCGFWLNRWKEKSPANAIKEMFSTLAGLVERGELVMPVHRVYPLTELAAAVEEAGRESRAGKVLLDLSA
ncbi:MAG: MDR family NADPH-dependent oxidoreductase [Terrimicrobiaceae bacterium]